MALSHETRRRVIFGFAAPIVVAMVLASSGCSTTVGTGEAGQDRDGPAALDADSYPTAVTDICAATDTQLAALPSPGDGISETDWAAEVASSLTAEAAALDDITAIGDLREDHASLVANTTDQAAQWQELSAAITAESSEAIDTARTEILELSGGRIELVTDMGIDGCRERSFGS